MRKQRPKPRSPNRLYHRHKSHAKRRNIEWHFSFEQWINWWEQHLGPNWMTMRGSKPNQYCMARHGDVGPYAPENVECKRYPENRAEQGRLTPTQVATIRTSNEHWSVFVNLFGVHRVTVQRIRNGKTWRKHHA
jgi:hypothetical protein